jgi:CelD/BcsL family acetyltransferase involved in cellulose biosynthesis
MNRTFLEQAAGSPPKRAAASTSRKPRFRVELHSDFDDQEFRSTWKSFEQSASTTAFQRLAYIEAIIKHVVPHQTVVPILVAVHEVPSGTVVLVAAMMRSSRLGAAVVGALDLGLCDYFAPLIRTGREFSPAEIRYIWREICRKLKPVDAISIKKIPVEVFGHPNPIAQLQSASLSDSFSTTIRLRSADGTRLVRLQDNSVFRKTSRLCQKTERWGSITLKLADTVPALHAAIDLMIEQRRERSRALGRGELLDDSGYAEFYRQLALGGLVDGFVRVFVLFSDANPIAVVYSLAHRNTLTVVVPSMTTEERWRKLSPGLVAMLKCCEWADSQSFHNFDLSVGDLPYKARFGGEQRPLLEIQQVLSPIGILIKAEAIARRMSRRLDTSHPKAKARVRQVLNRFFADAR